MKVLRENPLLLIWLVALTILGGYLLLPPKVNVQLNISADEGIKVTSTCSAEESKN
jgi:hypothetical protein